ncbi:DUF2550 domain-containing protein [Actinomadura rayongensis]|uniref:DUF2550 family protein n=1 Tax=Actinomadura rayongensis TaxID=1429076 RepID=A0A6I4W044_9ACTN|nr:DUF2550 domain-containing protein [Actinomadura rayongensis]MXQ62801.1 DUF2550 family protein [Actinomadura rayongensis]
MGGHLAADVGGVLAVVFLVAAVLFAVMAVRRRWFVRKGGTVECSLRVCPETGEPGPWRLGIARYQGDTLHWHRVFGFRARPRQVIHRRGLVVSGRRAPGDREAEGLLPGVEVIAVRDGGTRLELAMGASALTGFLSWLEAAPPGFPVDIPQTE